MTYRQRLGLIDRLRQLAKHQTDTDHATDVHLAATIIETESFDKRRIINEFIDKVEALAEEKMLKTGKLEGAHYAAMKQLQQEMNDE